MNPEKWKTYDPYDEIRTVWEHLNDDPENLRKALNELSPRPRSEAEQHLHHLDTLADDIEKLEREFSGTLMEVVG